MAISTTVFRADRRRLVRGSLWNAAGWAAALLTGPPVTIALVRTMTHSQFGLLAIAGAIVGPAAAIAALGLGPAVTQIASVEAVSAGTGGLAATLRAGLRTAVRALPWVVAGGICLVGLVTVVRGTRPAAAVVLVLLPVVMVAPLNSVFDGFLRATGSAKWMGVATAAASLVGAGAVVGIIAFGTPSAIPVAAARSLGALVGCAALAWAVLRWRTAFGRIEVPDGTTLPSVTVARLAAFSGAALLTGLSWLLISQLDVLFLGADRGRAAAGLYAPASRVADMAITIAALVGTMLLTALTTALQSGDHARAVHLYHWASRWALVATAPVLAVMLVAPESALRLLFGSGFADVATALQVLGVGVLLHVGFGFNGFMLEAHGVPRLAAGRSAAGILVSVVLCAVLIPRYGFTGAAIATAGAIGIVNVFSSSALLRRFRVAPWDAPFLLAIGGFAISLPISWALQRPLGSDLTRCAVTALLALAGAAAGSLLSRERAVAPLQQLR